jgi:hypothetical protein
VTTSSITLTITIPVVTSNTTWPMVYKLIINDGTTSYIYVITSLVNVASFPTPTPGGSTTATVTANYSNFANAGVVFSPVNGSTNSITASTFIFGGSQGRTELLQATTDGYSFTIPASSDGVPCFTAACSLLTPTGYKRVTEIMTGDLIVTQDQRHVRVIAYRFQVMGTERTAPYRISKNTLGEHDEVHLSPFHAIRISDQWNYPPVLQFYFPDKIEQYDLGKQITYYHFETPDYANDHLVCNGLVVDSYSGQQIQSNKPVYLFHKETCAFQRIIQA